MNNLTTDDASNIAQEIKSCKEILEDIRFILTGSLVGLLVLLLLLFVMFH